MVNQSLPNSSIHNTRSLSTTAPRIPSDHQVVFDRMPPPRNIPRLTTDTTVTQFVQGIEEQFRCDNLQIEYERRAQERRQALDRNNYNLHIPPSLDVQDINADISNERRIETSENNFSYSNPAPAPNPAPNPAPQYVPQDHELPSYEEAIATNNRASVAKKF